MALSYYSGFAQGDFGPQALAQAGDYCHLALNALQPIPETEVAWLKGTLWNALGFINASLGRWDEAIDCYHQDLALCQTQADRHGMGLTYGNLGELYQKQGDWPAALAAYQQALIIIREFDDRYEEADALANLAFLHQEMGQVEAALDYYGQAIHVIEALRAGVSSEAAQAGFFATVVDTYANMALLCLTLNRVEQAFNVIEQARSRAFLDLLATRAPELSQRLEARPLTLAEVQAALPPDALLLEYFTISLGGDQGLNIFVSGYPQSQSIACDLSGGVSDVEETVNAGGSSLTYEPSIEQYSYIWKTRKEWAGNCRQLVIRLNDGTEHLANFKFK